MKPRRVEEEAQRAAELLRSDMFRLAGLLRAQAEGMQLSTVDRRAVDRLANDRVTPVALVYAELVVDGEALVARLTDAAKPTLVALLRTRDRLSAQRKAASNQLKRLYRTLAEARRPASPDRLDDLVLRKMAGPVYEDALRTALERRGLPPDAVDRPKTNLWEWLTTNSLNPDGEREHVPNEVIALRRLDEEAFLQVVLADAQGTNPNRFLTHSALAERWATAMVSVRTRLEEARTRAADDVSRIPAGSLRDRSVGKLVVADRAYARGSARSMTAKWGLADLELRVAKVHRHESVQRVRAECLTDVAARLAETHPDLTRAVAVACAEHRAVCPEAEATPACPDCVNGLVKALGESLSESARESLLRPAAEDLPRPDDRLSGPDDVIEPAWWLSGDPTHRSELSWQTALLRPHIDDGRCIVPGGPLADAWHSRRIRLHINHQGGQGSFKPVQDVMLRCRNGRWSLDGVRWPPGLLPGTLVTVTWRPGGSLATAYTTLLPQPVRIDGVYFRHEYYAQVVTREMEPHHGQGRTVPDPSDVGWVLRTLRKLGYLSVDGSATLAEGALIRNCLRLGMPKSRSARVHRAVEQLLRSGRVRRVQGSLDPDGRPWFPPRPGHARATLLRYIPRVEALVSGPDASDGRQSSRSDHWVEGFVRRLPPGAQASPEQLDLHREAIRAAEVVDRPLPEGHTYVRRHRRDGSR